MSQPRHRDVAVVVGVAIVAGWAVLEMVRWRIRYMRLSASLASQSDPDKQLRKLLGDGRVLHANLASTAPWGWRMASVLPGRVARWETDVCEALRDKPEAYREFLGAPDWDPSDWNSRPA